MSSLPFSEAASACRACLGSTVAAFEAHVLDGIRARYDLCHNCGSLQVANPHWLAEAYSRNYFPDPDQGSLRRSQYLHRCIRRLRSRWIRWIPIGRRSLDFGSGRGLLLRLLLDDGHDAWGYDPYPGAILGEDRVLRELPSITFELIILAEVIEHLIDPDNVLERLLPRLALDGLLMISTELFNSALHGPDWHYLAPAHGQHIQFYSSEGLDRLMARHGLKRWSTLRFGDPSGNGEQIDFVHLYAHRGRPKPRFSEALLQWRHRRGERRLYGDHRA